MQENFLDNKVNGEHITHGPFLHCVKSSMSRLYGSPNEANARDFFDTFFNFGIYLNTHGNLPDMTILQFTRQNQNLAQGVLLELPTLFSIITSNLHYSYEDDGDRELELYKVCRIRSGMETYIELFEARLREKHITGWAGDFDDWINKSLELPKFDKQLRDKLKEFPLLRRRYIPDGIPSTHWWFQHPTEW